MGKLFDKTARAAHIKKNTKGTSNEISFSVLDAASHALDEDSKSSTGKMPSLLGGISLFTLGPGRRPSATPTKEKGLHLSSGEFVSTEGGGSTDSGTPTVLAPATPLNAPTPASTAPKTPALPIGTPKSSGESRSWSLPADEVARKKSSRMRRKVLAITCCVLVTAAAVGFGATSLYSMFQTQQDLRARMVAILDDVESADQTLVQFDELVVSQINTNFIYDGSTERIDAYAEMDGALDDAYEDLVDARRLTEHLIGYLTDEGDKEVANQTISAINARSNMIQAGRGIMEEAELENQQCAAFEAAWDQLLVADALAREGASLVTNTSKETVTASTEKTKEAIAAFSVASDLFAEVQYLAPDVDFSVFQEYVALREESLHHAVASNEAYLARDKETTASENEKYNELDAQAAELARTIEGSPLELLEQGARDRAAEMVDQYASQREIAGTADSLLRDFQSQA